MDIEELKELLEVELFNMKQDKKIRRFEVAFNSSTKKFDIWLEWLDVHACTLKDILTVQDLKTELAKSLPVKKSWKCHICRYYLKNCDGCKKGFYNSMFIPCPDWKAVEMQPTDKDLCDCLDALISETSNMVDPIEHVHKGADWMMCYILKMVGYEKGIKIFEDQPKGYATDTEGYLDYNERIIDWQCDICRRWNWKELCCPFGLNEGWEENNKCRAFVPFETQLTPKYFVELMENIKNETRDAECTFETIHHNMDMVLSYLMGSIGYSKFATKYRALNLQYFDVPF